MNASKPIVPRPPPNPQGSFMSRNHVSPDRTDQRYFVITPHLIFALSRDAYDIAAWGAVKMIAGDGGECTLATAELGQLAGMSAGKMQNCRAYLLAIHLLEGQMIRDAGYPQPIWHLRIPDLWPRNIAMREQLGPDLHQRIAAIVNLRAATQAEMAKSVHVVNALLEEERSCGVGHHSPGESRMAPGESRIAPHELKDNQDPEPNPEPKEEPPSQELWQRVQNQLRLQMARTAYNAWMAPAQLLRHQGTHFVVGTPNAYAQEWLGIRLRPLIVRTIESLTGTPTTVEFIVEGNA